MATSIQLDWKAATWSGIIAGFVFLVLEMLMVPIFGGGSPWGPPRMIAAIVLGEGVLPPPPTFSAGIVAVAMVLHFVLSIVYALIFALVINRLGLGTALAIGAAGGLILYLVNFYGFTALFPWFAMARNWIPSSPTSSSAWPFPACTYRSGSTMFRRRRMAGLPSRKGRFDNRLLSVRSKARNSRDLRAFFRSFG